LPPNGGDRRKSQTGAIEVIRARGCRNSAASLSALCLVTGCGVTSSPVASPRESPPTYNFAVAEEHRNADAIQGLRATIQWSVAPITAQDSAQSTWIGIFGQSEPATHLSLKVAQVGWKQLGTTPVRVFWEWGTNSHDNRIHYGPAVRPAEPLSVELDRDPTGSFIFWANGIQLGQIPLPWTPTYLAVGAETHQPSDVMAGSSRVPELITSVEWELNGTWQPLKLATFSTYPTYQIASDSEGTLRIWDLRQPS